MEKWEIGTEGFGKLITTTYCIYHNNIASASKRKTAFPQPDAGPSTDVNMTSSGQEDTQGIGRKRGGSTCTVV